MAPTQQHRPAAVSCPLGDDVLLLRRLVVREQLSQPFEMQLEVFSEDFQIALADLLGQPVAIRLNLPDEQTRYFHGFCSQFTFAGQERNLAVYRATLHPWLWFLGRTADCRIFQEMTVPDIVQEIFREHGFSDFDNLLTAEYRQWDYCVQYRESDLSFVSRLMEHEGIYYYFKHEANKHNLVLADSYSSHDFIEGYNEVPYYPPNERRERDHIFQWEVSQSVQSGSFVLTDYDFERPSTDLETRINLARSHALADYEVFDYPGTYLETSDGEHYVKNRMEELAAQYERATAEGNARGLATGHLFSLVNYPRIDQNREYLVISAVHTLEDNSYETVEKNKSSSLVVYRGNWSVMPSAESFRPPRVTPKPVVKGPQTAVVVGRSGEEIWTDEYGRVKVQFHWDRYGASDEESSCWVRVAQVWAGKNFGAMHIPRIGQEVIVHFLEGDPDQPIIVGRVYNADQMPPYALPDNQTQSGIKSRSTKEGDGETFNELRFEDKKDEEEIYFHAEKDFVRIVENNDTLRVGFDKQDEGNQTIDIYNNRTVTVDQGNDKLQVKTGNREVIVDEGNDTHEISQGDREVTIDEGNDTLTIGQGDRETTIEQGSDTLTISQGDLTISIDAGSGTIEAGNTLELKVGQSSIKLEASKITIASTQIEVAADASIDLSGAMATLSGDASTEISGGIIKLN
jgi:type VI secretion system secreted protein VgrG